MTAETPGEFVERRHGTAPFGLDRSRSSGLDGLRVFAALFVAAFHLKTVSGVSFGPLDPIVQGGDSGVYLFFALSGYLLYRPFVRGPVDLTGFALKRAGRILPGYYVALVGLTILTGNRRRDGYARSIRMSSKYGGVRLWKRPIVANNVIALLDTAWRVCAASQRFLANLVLEGKNCEPSGLLGPGDLDSSGRPLGDSAVIGYANRHYAPPIDVTGRPRDAQPDIGAYEYRG